MTRRKGIGVNVPVETIAKIAFLLMIAGIIAVVLLAPLAGQVYRNFVKPGIDAAAAIPAALDDLGDLLTSATGGDPDSLTDEECSQEPDFRWVSMEVKQVDNSQGSNDAILTFNRPITQPRKDAFKSRATPRNLFVDGVLFDKNSPKKAYLDMHWEGKKANNGDSITVYPVAQEEFRVKTGDGCDATLQQMECTDGYADGNADKCGSGGTNNGEWKVKLFEGGEEVQISKNEDPDLQSGENSIIADSAEVKSGNKAALFTEQQFKGTKMTIVGNAEKIGFNDDTRAVKVDGGASCQATLYGDNRKGGRYVTLSGGGPNSIAGETGNLPDGTGGTPGWKPSSIRIKDGCYVKVWEQPGFGGIGPKTIRNDQAQLNQVEGQDGGGGSPLLCGSNWGNCIESIQVFGGDSCWATLYNQRNHDASDGKYMTVAGDSDRLQLGNAVSSAEVGGGNSCQATLQDNPGVGSGNSVTLVGESTGLGFPNGPVSIRISSR